MLNSYQGRKVNKRMQTSVKLKDDHPCMYRKAEHVRTYTENGIQIRVFSEGVRDPDPKPVDWKKSMSRFF